MTLLLGAAIIGPHWILSVALVAELLYLAIVILREQHRSVPQCLVETGICFFWGIVLPHL